MVYLKKKKIGRGTYTYLVKSIRMPDGKVKTVQKLVKGNETAVPALDAAEKKLRGEWACGKFAKDDIFSEEEIRKIEALRIDYGRTLKGLSKNQLKDLFDRFTANFTYESNALEGNSLTLKDVAIVLFEKTGVAGGKALREIYETLNSRKVVEAILGRKFRIDERSVLKMHRALVANMGIPAGYKRVPNYLIGRDVETCVPEQVPAEMNSLFEHYEKNRETVHPLQLAAHIHGLFEEIHPFEDGNGRVGRFLINVALVNGGYPPLIIRKSQRVAYLNALEKFDSGNRRALERFLLERCKETYEKFFAVYVKYLR
ncbi:MAG: Fic family protein [archaeon]